MAGWDSPPSRTAADDFDAAMYEKVRLSLVASSWGEFSLGGSRTHACQEGGGYKDAPEFVDFVVPASAYGNNSGLTFEAVIETRVEDSSVTVTPKMRRLNNTPGDVVVGSASNSTTGTLNGDIWASQTLTITAAAGDILRLMTVKSADTFGAWVMGKIRRKGT